MPLIILQCFRIFVSIQKFRSSPQTQCSNTTEGSKSDIDIKTLLFEENMLKAVDDQNMIVKEFGKVLLLEMQLHFCVCRLQKKNVPLSVTRLWENVLMRIWI